MSKGVKGVSDLFTDNTQNLTDPESPTPADSFQDTEAPVNATADAVANTDTDAGIDTDVDTDMDADTDAGGDVPINADASAGTGILTGENFSNIEGESPALSAPVQNVPFEEWAEPTPTLVQETEVTPAPVQAEPTPTPVPITATPVPDQSQQVTPFTPEQLAKLQSALEQTSLDNVEAVPGDSSEEYTIDDVYTLLSDWIDWQKDQIELNSTQKEEEKAQDEEQQAQLTEYRDYMTQQSRNIFSITCLIFLSVAFLSGILFSRIIWRKL